MRIADLINIEPAQAVAAQPPPVELALPARRADEASDVDEERCPFVLVHAGKGRPAPHSRSARSYDSDDSHGSPRYEAVGEQPGGGYLLVSVRRYRLQTRLGGGLGASGAGHWHGRVLRVRLVFHDNGQAVPALDNSAGPLLAFPTEAGPYGLPVSSVSLRMDASGASSASFGIGASTHRHGGRLFRLTFEDDSGQAIASFGPIRTVAHLPRAPRRPRSSAGAVLSVATEENGEAAVAIKRARAEAAARRPRAGKSGRRSALALPASPSASEPGSADGDDAASTASASSDGARSASCSLFDLAAIACASAPADPRPAKRPRPAPEPAPLQLAMDRLPFPSWPSFPVYTVS
eukprot:tig00020510_g9810.t1